jgi:hypothetical protein
VVLKCHIASLGFRTSGGVRNWNFGGAQMSFWVLRVFHFRQAEFRTGFFLGWCSNVILGR